METSSLNERGKEEHLHFLLLQAFNGEEVISLRYPDSMKVHRHSSGENVEIQRSISIDVGSVTLSIAYRMYNWAGRSCTCLGERAEE